MIHLSQYFTMAEMTRSTTALRRNIPNVPSPAHIENLHRLCRNLLDPLRRHLGVPVKITSGFRSRTVNGLVGGNPNSAHLHGRAADLDLDGELQAKAALWLWENRESLPLDQCILEGGPQGWLHVAIPRMDIGETPRRMFLIDHDGNGNRCPAIPWTPPA